MKTTLDLPDELLTEAKAAAARRRTTLKAIMEHALRRELGESARVREESGAGTMLNGYGFPVLKRSGKGRVTSSLVYTLQERGELE